MRIGNIGGRNFAMELEWVRLDGVPVKVHAKEVAAEHGKTYCASVPTSDGSVVCGTGQLAEGERAPKRPLYSFAAALASIGSSAIYVGHVVDDATEVARLWYTVVTDGEVSPGTDVTVPFEDGIAAITELSQTLRIPVMVMGEVAGLESAESFDPADLLARVKPKAMVAVEHGIPKSRAAATAVALLAIAGIGYHQYGQYKLRAAQQAAAAAEAQAQAAYISQIRLIADALPTSNHWIGTALSRAISSMPAWYAGWELQDVTCTPARCEAKYKPSNDGFSYVAMVDRFGSQRSRWSDQDRLLYVSIEQKVETTAAPWTDDKLLSPDPAKLRSLAVVGLLPGAVKGITAKETSTNLSAQFSAPGGAGTLWQDDIDTEASFYLDVPTVSTLSGLMGNAGFVARQMTFTRGKESSMPTWKLTWTRLRGESTYE